MAYQDVPTGDNPPEQINLVIEIQRGGGQNKYEVDKKTGLLTLDRVNGTTGTYPADYGYVPGTLCDDGDPLDALLIIDESVVHGAVVPARPVGVLYMIDDGEGDEKLICVPRDDISKDYIKDLSDLEPNFQKKVEQFYRHYKDWKKDWQGISVEFKGWGGAQEAQKVINESIERAKSKS
jgi:inorganic pyrophosphatase